MPVKSKKNKNSVALAIYFGIAVFLIILISLVFKGIDIVKNSKFDSSHRLTVAVVGKDDTQVLSVNPKDGTMFRLKIKGHLEESELREMSVPIDAYVKVDDDGLEDVSPKSVFSKILFKFSKIKTDLSIIDKLRLSIFSGGINSDNVEEQEVSSRDISKIDNISSNFFKDQLISSEKVNIQITNTTDVPGLGNKLAKYITNLGGVVVIVNSSPKKAEKSKIVCSEESDTVKRLSKIFGIPVEKGEGSALADVIIVLGEDKNNLFEQ